MCRDAATGWCILRSRALLAALVLSAGWHNAGCSDSPAAPPEVSQPTTLCPEAAPSGLVFCASFGDSFNQRLVNTGGELRLENGASLTAGRLGQALLVDGVDDRAVLDSFSMGASIVTVEAWVRPDGTQVPWATVIDFAPGEGFWVGTSPLGTGWEFWVGPQNVWAESTLVLGGWHHLAGVFDWNAQRMRLYINGALYNEGDITDPLLDGPAPLALGAPLNPPPEIDYFRGAVDEVMVWASARSPTEICSDAGGTPSTGGCQLPDVASLPPPAEVTACDGVPAWLATYRDNYASGLDPTLITAANDFVAAYTPVNPAFVPAAEAWITLGTTGLVYDRLELVCLAYLQAAAIDPTNAVALSNAAMCALLLDDFLAAQTLLDCSLSIVPNNAAAHVNQAYLDYWSGDPYAALAELDAAIAAEPRNYEWPYQALNLAAELGDMSAATSYGSMLPPSSGSTAGYRQTLPPSNGSQIGYCCPCAEGAGSYPTASDCTSACQVSLACFTNICALTGDCSLNLLSLFSASFQMCYPPSGAQVCLEVDTDGNVQLTVGGSLWNGFLGASAGVSYNIISGNVAFVVEVEAEGRELSFTMEPGGNVQGAVGFEPAALPGQLNFNASAAARLIY